MTIHDHFDGSAHCVECGGPCRLDPESAAVTGVIRHLYEALASTGTGPNMMVRSAMEKLGLDAMGFWMRARGATEREWRGRYPR